MQRLLALSLVPFTLLLLAPLPRDAPVTIHLAGDSTMAEKAEDRRPETGWGEALAAAFREGTVRVVNHARNGRSTRTFITEGRWEALLEGVRAGDYVFVQFGHNDQPKEKVGRHTTPAEFRANLSRFVDDVRARGAMPVLFTPVVRRRFDAEGRFYDTHAGYPDLVRALAAERRVPLVDLHRASAAVVRRHGAEDSRRLFLWLAPGAHANYPDGLEDDTHFSPYGAETMAALAVREIRALGLGLAEHLKAGEDAG